jgi:hypothetical protein
MLYDIGNITSDLGIIFYSSGNVYHFMRVIIVSMRINRKGNISIVALSIGLLVTTIGAFTFFRSIAFNKNVSNSQMSFGSQLDIVQKGISYATTN